MFRLRDTEAGEIRLSAYGIAMPNILSRQGAPAGSPAARRYRDNFLRRIWQYSPAAVAASRLNQQELAIQFGFLSFYDFKLGNASIRKNKTYVGGIGPELFTNPGQVNGAGSPYTFTGDNPDGYTITGEVGNDPEISEVGAGEGHAASPNPGGGHVNIFSGAGSPITYDQAVVVVGDTYRSVVDVDTVIAQSIIRTSAGGSNNIGPVILSPGVTTHDFVNIHNTGFGLKRGAAGTDITLNGHSVKKIGERDLIAAGTITNVAGPQGYRTGILGAERVLNGDFTAWTADNPDDWTVTGEAAGDEITERDSGQLHADTKTVGGSVNMFEPAGNTLILRQNGRLTVGQYYRAVFVVSANASAVTVLFGDGVGTAETFVNAGQTGTFTVDFIANGTDVVFNHSPGACDVTIDSISVRPYITPGAVFLDGATSDLHSVGTAQDGLTNMTLLMQVVGQFISGVSGLASKTLAEKSGEWKLEVNASDQLVFTRNRATTNATATTVNSWPNTDVSGFGRRKLEIAVTVDSNGFIDIWVNGQLEPTTGVTGSGAFVSNTNAIYWGMNAAVSAGMKGNFGPAGLENRVLSDQEIVTWFASLTGDSYSTPTLESFLTHMNSLTGIDVRYWDATETSGNMIEGIGSGNDAVLSGTTVQGLAGKRGENAGVLGTEELTNSSFDDGGTGWLQIAGGNPVTFSGGQASWEHTPSTDPSTGIYQTSVLTIGQSYRVRIVVPVLDYISGTGLRVTGPSGSTYIYQLITAPGTYEFDIVSGETGIMLWTPNGNDISSVVIDEVSVKPYTTPSAVLADGATSLASLSANAAFDGMPTLSIFSVVHPFSAGENAAGRILDKGVSDLIFGLVGNNIYAFVNYATTDINGAISGAVVTFNQWQSLGMTLNDATKTAIGYRNGSEQTSLTGSGGRVGASDAISFLNRPAADRTLDGLLDLVVLVKGFNASPHWHKRMNDFIF